MKTILKLTLAALFCVAVLTLGKLHPADTTYTNRRRVAGKLRAAEYRLRCR